MDSHGDDWIYIGDIKSAHARLLLRLAAKRTAWAERHYSPLFGLLDISSDPRDFRAEGFLEAVDKSWYDTADAMRDLMKKYTQEEILQFATGGDLNRR